MSPHFLKIHGRQSFKMPSRPQPPAEKPDGAPEWMVSYADMITIMLSFFVVMFSVSTGETGKGKRAKQQEAINSLQNRFGPNWKPFSGWSFLPGGSLGKDGGVNNGKQPAPPSHGDALTSARNVKLERSRIRVPGQGDHIAIGGPVDFENESLVVPPQQQARLRAIADEMKGKPQQVEIRSIASARAMPAGAAYHDRWDLAYARCRKTAEILATMNIEPERFSITVLPAVAPPSDRTVTTTPGDGEVEVYLSETLPADDVRLR